MLAFGGLDLSDARPNEREEVVPAVGVLEVKGRRWEGNGLLDDDSHVEDAENVDDARTQREERKTYLPLPILPSLHVHFRYSISQAHSVTRTQTREGKSRRKV